MIEVKLFKKLPDGRYIFVREGVYFTLTKEQAESIIALINKHEEKE